jgi:small subunit ribosomal protein S1
VEGAVARAVKGGVEVDVGGVRAFCPASQLELGQARPLEEYVGQTLAFVVLEVSDAGRSVVLSRRALLEQQGATAIVPAPDEVLDAKVIKALDHGVLVETSKGRGLVPARDLNLAPGADHRRALPVGTMLRVVLASYDPETGRLRFSVSGVNTVEEKRHHREYSERALGGSFGSLGDVLRDKLPKESAKAAERAPGVVRRRVKKH